MPTSTRWVLGLESGSDAAGVNAALLEVQGVGLELRPRVALSLLQPYPRDVRDLLRRSARPGPVEVPALATLHQFVGEAFALAARQLADRAGLSLAKVQCVGCSGHALWHEADDRHRASVVLGPAAVVAERTGVTTVGDFGARDLAARGQGLPLTALADYLLFRPTAPSCALLHLGGTAQVVWLPADGRAQDVVAFEAGPCNLLLDALIRCLTGGREEFDPGGKHAVQGHCLEPLLERWLGHPFFQRRPPRCLSRQAFGEEFVAGLVQAARQANWSMHDLLCTATHFIARGIAGALCRCLPEGRRVERALLSGGGTRNGFLWHLLAQQLAGVPLQRTDELGVPAEARKAAGFGVLAALALDCVPANLPAVTGASGSRLLGSLTPGSATNWSRCLGWMASQGLQPALHAA